VSQRTPAHIATAAAAAVVRAAPSLRFSWVQPLPQVRRGYSRPSSVLSVLPVRLTADHCHSHHAWNDPQEKCYLAELDAVRAEHAAEARAADNWAAAPPATQTTGTGASYTLPPSMVAEHLEREALAALAEAAGTGLPCRPVDEPHVDS